MTLPIAFLAGVIAFASPCFLPIVPVFVGYLAGGMAEERVKIPALVGAGRPDRDGFIRSAPAPRAAGGKGVTGARRVSPLVNTVAFILGFTVVFVALWGALTALGAALAGLRTAVRIGGGIILILLGLYSLGFLRLGSKADQAAVLGRIDLTAPPSPARSAAIGVAFAAGLSPCVGPVLGVIIGMSMNSETAAGGLALMVTFCLGLGAPMLLLALGVHGVTARLGGLAKYGPTIRVISGILLLILGFLMITDLLAPLSGLTFGSL
ncbi:cytochrome c biogenesis CcdA family protein [Actinomyces minihominis]|uniref:cytochrome c biogenesis CcdA family protein n=1 Tax=Actinomyces minihominis TaxID=2002838 RepID=UPI00101AE26B|nr:cytochrome c biogenesis CcdA family protein [Actinomyces minihominis]